MCTHLTKRSGSSNYYFRRKIPLDLLPHYGGKKEVMRSLGTTDKREAERLAREAGVQLDDEFAALRQPTIAASPDSPPSTAPTPRRVDTDYAARRYLAHLRKTRNEAAAKGGDHLAEFMAERRQQLAIHEAALHGALRPTYPYTSTRPCGTRCGPF